MDTTTGAPRAYDPGDPFGLGLAARATGIARRELNYLISRYRLAGNRSRKDGDEYSATLHDATADLFERQLALLDEGRLPNGS